LYEKDAVTFSAFHHPPPSLLCPCVTTSVDTLTYAVKTPVVSSNIIIPNYSYV